MTTSAPPRVMFFRGLGVAAVARIQIDEQAKHCQICRSGVDSGRVCVCVCEREREKLTEAFEKVRKNQAVERMRILVGMEVEDEESAALEDSFMDEFNRNRSLSTKQCIGDAFGGKIVPSPSGAVRGKSSLIYHDEKGHGSLFTGLSNPFAAGRYHCFMIEKERCTAGIVQASVAANTWVVSGSPQTKKLQDILPGIINQLEQFQKQMPGAKAEVNGTKTQEDEDDEVPNLVLGENFEAAAEEGRQAS